MSNKRDKSHPRLLPQVLRAVAELKDINGSTAKKIVSRVNELIKRCRTSGPKPRNVTMQVRKALHHGIENGLLKYRGGRYKLVFGGKSRNTRTMATRRTAAAPAPRRRQANASKGRTRKRTTRPKAVQRKKRKRSSSSSKSSSSEDNTTSGDGNETTDSASSMTVSGSSASSSMNTSDARDSTSQSVESFTVESKKDDKNNKSSGRCKTKKNTVGMPTSLWCLIKERCGLSTQRGVRTKETTTNKKTAKKPLRRNKHKKHILRLCRFIIIRR
ncbi:uncharacterized protein LOC108741457 isoform X3 [Agrilus planipennis]|uniref:Uncharacterized protein LOC108741457 isoform X3 n=1 Tax=Agrilus planipennis TaxID=224129 RepID=A0A1W4X6V5_AGRPL|nr:uncharacterized protein LOC108741457 isoform X3 [Agrilus planipennis]